MVPRSAHGVLVRVPRLPPELENKLWQELTTLECNKRMPYVTSVERIGYQRGRQEEAGALVQRQLRRRFGPLAQETEDQIVALPLERVEALGEDLLDFNSLVDLDAWLRRH
jgi:hypothetical protein